MFHKKIFTRLTLSAAALGSVDLRTLSYAAGGV